MTSASVFSIRMALLYAVIAMTGGLYMAITGDHTAFVAHAHLAIIGWFGLLTTGFLFRSQPQIARGRQAWLIALMLAVGLPVMALGVALIAYGMTWAVPVAVVGSLVVYGSALLLCIRVWLVEIS